MPETFGTMGFLAQGTGLLMEPLKKHTWELVIDSLDITLAAQSVRLPKYEIEQEKIHHFNEATHVASKPQIGKLGVTVLDVVDPDIAGQLDTWFNKIYDAKTGRIGYKKDYVKSGSIYLYDVAGQLIRQWRCIGLFPLSNPVPEDALDYASSESVKISADFSVDRMFKV